MTILERALPAKKLSPSGEGFIKCLLAGHSGSGKTQSSITLPHSEDRPLLLVDFDGRAETIAGEPAVEVLRLFDPDPSSPRAWEDGEKLRKELWSLARKCTKEQKPFPYSGIIEDSLSMMSRVAMNSALLLDRKRGLGGAPAQQHWIPQIHYLVKHINAMRQLPCHYILTCHMELVMDEESQKIHVLPKITRSLRTELPSWFNETYYCSRTEEKGKVLYWWTTGGTGRYEFFKSSLNNKGRFWKDPIRIDFDNPPVGFQKLLALRAKGGQG